jgi:protein SCO1/2
MLLALMLLFGCKNQQSKDDEQTTTTPPAGSVYQMDMDFVNQWGQPVKWSSLGGKVQVMAMIFTHCEYACPRITQDIKEIEKKLNIRDSSKIGFTLISFDVQRDTSARLLKYYNERGLDKKWQLLHGSLDDVQTVSAMLDVKFQPGAKGLFSHQNIITVISPEGEIIKRQEGLKQNPDDIVKLIKHEMKDDDD